VGCDVRADHGTPHGQRLEEHNGQSFGEAGQDQRPGRHEFFENPLVAQVTGDAYPVLQAKLLDQPLDLPAHRAITNDDQLKVEPAIAQPGCGLDQDCLSFLLHDAANVHQARSRRDRYRTAVKEHRADPAMDNVDLGPVVVICPAVELAPGELADRDHESGTPDLLAQAVGSGSIKLLRAVHGEAVGRSPQNTAEHGDSCGIGSIMSVYVIDSEVGRPLQENAGLGKVDQRSP